MIWRRRHPRRPRRPRKFFASFSLGSRGTSGSLPVHRQRKRRVDLHVVDTAAHQLVEGFGA